MNHDFVLSGEDVAVNELIRFFIICSERLTQEKQKQELETWKIYFEQNMNHHREAQWSNIERNLKAVPAKTAVPQ